MAEGEAFHRLVSGIDYPMFIVTAAAGGERSGCLVGFATQASIDPPRLLVMISKANHTFGVAVEAEQLVVHFLHEGNRAVSELFGEETGDEIDKFERCEWESVEGVDPPVLVGTRGWVAGTVIERFDAGDHVGHLLQVGRARVDIDEPQLTFQMVRDMTPGHPA
jgi:flavin reductase (DIM6/NTAB) family NADH-FMN oxidoreductase RutF